MNTQSPNFQNKISLQYSIDGGYYLLNDVILSKEELCVYFEFHGFEVPRCLSELKFRSTVFRTLEGLDYDTIVQSLDIYSNNKIAIKAILVERGAFLEGSFSLYQALLEKNDDFLSYFSSN